MYVLQVKPGAEDIVLKQLNDKGLSGKVPKILKYKHVKGEFIPSTDIIFKGYVFTDVKYNADNYYDIKEIKEVIKFLNADDDPVPLNTVEEAYINILDKMGLEPCKISFDDKDNAKVVSGCIAYFESKIKKIDKHKRIASFELKIKDKIYDIEMGFDIV